MCLDKTNLTRPLSVPLLTLSANKVTRDALASGKFESESKKVTSQVQEANIVINHVLLKTTLEINAGEARIYL